MFKIGVTLVPQSIYDQTLPKLILTKPISKSRGFLQLKCWNMFFLHKNWSKMIQNVCSATGNCPSADPIFYPSAIHLAESRSISKYHSDNAMKPKGGYKLFAYKWYDISSKRQDLEQNGTKLVAQHCKFQKRHSTTVLMKLLMLFVPKTEPIGWFFSATGAPSHSSHMRLSLRQAQSFDSAPASCRPPGIHCAKRRAMDPLDLQSKKASKNCSKVSVVLSQKKKMVQFFISFLVFQCFAVLGSSKRHSKSAELATILDGRALKATLLGPSTGELRWSKSFSAAQHDRNRHQFGWKLDFCGTKSQCVLGAKHHGSRKTYVDWPWQAKLHSQRPGQSLLESLVAVMWHAAAHPLQPAKDGTKKSSLDAQIQVKKIQNSPKVCQTSPKFQVFTQVIPKIPSAKAPLEVRWPAAENAHPWPTGPGPASHRALHPPRLRRCGAWKAPHLETTFTETWMYLKKKKKKQHWHHWCTSNVYNWMVSFFCEIWPDMNDYN